MTGGAFGTRKTECVHGHSLEDAYIYEKEKNGKVYTIRECRSCRCQRNTQFKSRKRKDKPRRLKGERVLVVAEALLDCGHDMLYRPIPQINDVVWCDRCSGYRVRVKRTVSVNAD